MSATRRTSTLAAVAVVGLAAPVLSVLGPAAASGAAPLCRGQKATAVGSGHRVDGTDGADVIVTNGARAVYAKGGDDLVCITGPYTGRFLPVDVRAGDGDDVVDGSGSSRQEVYASMGSGVDTFLGGGADDVVELEHPDAAGGVDRVSGAGGDDTVAIRTGPGDVVVDNAAGRFTSAGALLATWSGVEGFSIDQSAGSHRMTFVGTDADESVSWSAWDDAVVDVTLGRGADHWSSPEPPPASSRLLGGPGRDGLYIASEDAGLDLDLPAGTMAVATAAAYDLAVTDFEDAELFAPRVDLLGTDGPNDIGLTACTGVVRLGGGDDSVRRRYDADYETDIRCGEVLAATGGPGDDDLSGTGGDDVLEGGSGKDVLIGGFGDDRLLGGRGDDSLSGKDGRDVLLGGMGRDRADGGTGRDRCVAERERRCER